MKKKYLFLVARGAFQSKDRMRDIADIIALHRFANLVIAYAPGSSYTTESATFINEKFDAPVITSVQADFDYAKKNAPTPEKQGNQLLAFLTHAMTQEDADAIVLVGRPATMAGTAKAVQAQYLWDTAQSIGKCAFFFKPGDLLVIDLERKVAMFYENNVPANLHSSAKGV